MIRIGVSQATAHRFNHLLRHLSPTRPIKKHGPAAYRLLRQSWELATAGINEGWVLIS